MNKILIGNSFPLTLVKNKVLISSIDVDEIKALISEGAEICSFWGHSNTVSIAETMLGCNIKCDRVALDVNKNGGILHPQGGEFRVLYTLTPNYKEAFRPQIGVEVTPDQILGWQALKIEIL
jgi:hypothetical protein